MMRLQIVQLGDGLAVVLPQEVARHLDVQEGSQVKANFGVDGNLVLQPSAGENRHWIPARVMLRDYPELRKIAWQVHTDYLRPAEAWGIYERNWRHIDESALTPSEKTLIEALRIALI